MKPEDLKKIVNDIPTADQPRKVDKKSPTARQILKSHTATFDRKGLRIEKPLKDKLYLQTPDGSSLSPEFQKKYRIGLHKNENVSDSNFALITCREKLAYEIENTFQRLKLLQDALFNIDDLILMDKDIDQKVRGSILDGRFDRYMRMKVEAGLAEKESEGLSIGETDEALSFNRIKTGEEISDELYRETGARLKQHVIDEINERPNVKAMIRKQILDSLEQKKKENESK